MKWLFKFSLRDLIYLTTIVAMAVALWMTWNKVPPPPSVTPGSIPAGVAEMTIEGPILVAFREQTSPTSASNFSGIELRALHFLEDAVIFEYADGRFRRFEPSQITRLSWKAK